jgi:hypothetical protein
LYSSRINKGTHKGVWRLEEFYRKASKNYKFPLSVLKCDIEKFFDNIDHKILFKIIQNKISDKNTLWLIESVIKSFKKQPNKGVPLGNVTSQLFANIYLNKLDKFIKHKLKVKYYIRYCDDFLILDENKKYLEKIIPKINNFLQNELKLSLHSDKIIIRKCHQGIDFLGYVSFPYHRILRTKTKRRMFRKIKGKFQELKRDKISKESFNQTIQSYLGVLKHCNSYKIKKEIENLIFKKL